MMVRSVFFVLAGLTAMSAVPASSRADTIFEVEHARAIARAGGPVSALDAELLDRYGAQSGTPRWRGRYDGDRYEAYGYRRYHHRRLRAYRN